LAFTSTIFHFTHSKIYQPPKSSEPLQHFTIDLNFKRFHKMALSPTCRPPASGSSRKRSSPVSGPDYESDSDKEQLINHDSKRARIDTYDPKYVQVAPLFSRKRRAFSQKPNEEQAGYVDDYYIGQPQDTEQVIIPQSAKRAKINGSSSAASSEQDENVNMDKTPGDQDAKEFEGQLSEEKYGHGAESEEEDQPQEKECEEFDLRYIPANPPKLAFVLQPPVKDLSWNKGQWAPTFPYTNQSEDCPIDFDYVRERADWLTDADIDVYTLRKPWVPVGMEVEYDQVKDMFNAAVDTSVISLEELRNRFGKANLAVFKTTGVWFEGSTHGLDGYECEARTAAELQELDNDANDADDDDDVANVPEPFPVVKEQLQQGERLVTFVLQPPRSVCDDRCVECCQSRLCYDEECREAWRRYQGSHSDSESDISDTEDDYEPYHLGSHSKERWDEVLSQQHTPFGCRTHQPAYKRFVHHEKFAAVRASRSPVRPVYVVDVSQRAFGLFASCFAPEFLGGFPKKPKQLCVYFRQEDIDKGRDFYEAVYEDIGNYTIGDVLEAYCCSQALDCPIVSDILISQLWNVLGDGESVKLFEPEYVRYVFHHTNASDPIRLLLLDAFRLKMAHARIMMRQHRHQYPPEMVRYWDHWNRQQDHEITPENQRKIDDHMAQTYEGRLAVGNGLRGIIHNVAESDEWPDDQEGDIWDKCVFTGWLSHAWKGPTGRLSREELHERLTQSDSVEILSSGNDRLFWETYRNRLKDVD
jgi:hypothetical protein